MNQQTFHYTNKEGWNAIKSQPLWVFKVSQPQTPERPTGVYFTDIEPTTENLKTLCKRLRIPKTKSEFIFCFKDRDNLIQLNGGLGRDERIFYSPVDYSVTHERQIYQGETVHYNPS